MGVGWSLYNRREQVSRIQLFCKKLKEIQLEDNTTCAAFHYAQDALSFGWRISFHMSYHRVLKERMYSLQLTLKIVSLIILSGCRTLA